MTEARPSARRVLVAITGASGAVYGWRLLQVLREVPDVESHLVVSPCGWTTLRHELDLGPETLQPMVHRLHDAGDLGAGPASGSFRCHGMVIAPCSMRTLGGVAHRTDPIYHSTYTGKPPDEPAVLGMALNELFIPLLQRQFPEITDFHLPPEGCSYRMAVVSIRKAYAGHARRIMMGIWSHLRQFMYTKFIVVVDDDIDVRDWREVIWAITTRMDPARDSFTIERTPIDYLDFASPVSGLGSKMGLDATNKWPGETQREWGRTMQMDPAVKARMDAMAQELGL